jgi:hypothetical protein
MSTAIAIEGVTKRFGSVVAVDGLDLRVPRGSLYGFMRLGWPCGRPPPAWQVVLSVVLTTLTAMAIVWAAGKIFRTGLLMQGKPPSFVELARWVMAK